MAFQDRLSNALKCSYTYSLMNDAANGKNVLAGMDDTQTTQEKFKLIARYNHQGCQDIQGLLWFADPLFYRYLWDKPPSKTALEKAITQLLNA